MKLGLVGWPSETGLGMEIRDAAKYLPISGTFFLKHPGKPMSQEYQDQAHHPRKEEMIRFLDETGVDTILSWESPGSWEFPKIWKERGIRWFLVIHWDWFTPARIEDIQDAILISPFPSCVGMLLAGYGLQSTHLQVPIDLERLPFRHKNAAKSFMTAYGTGGLHERRSLNEILRAWEILGPDAPELTVYAQNNPLSRSVPKGVMFKAGGVPTPADLYRDHDVALFPSKYEGVGLSLMEAQACGLPVITSDMEPMRGLSDWRVSGVTKAVEIMEDHFVEAFYPDPESIAQRVKQFCTADITPMSKSSRSKAELFWSWGNLREEWVSFLEEK